MRALVRRIEVQELAVLVRREHVGFRGSLAEVRISDPQLRIRTELARRIAVYQLPEVLARDQPPFLVQILRPVLDQKPVGLQGARRRLLRTAARAGACQHNQQENNRASELRHSCHTSTGPVDDEASHRYSAWIPSSSVTF